MYAMYMFDRGMTKMHTHPPNLLKNELYDVYVILENFTEIFCGESVAQLSESEYS